MARRLVYALSFSMCIALVLSVVVSNLPGHPVSISVFRFEQPKIGKEIVVDLFTFFRTHYNIKRVTWDSTTLYVDMRVIPAETVDQAALYRDFYLVVYHSLDRLRRLESVKVRLLEEPSSSSSKLLIAVTGDRSHFSRLTHPSRVKDYEAAVNRHFLVRVEPAFREKMQHE